MLELTKTVLKAVSFDRFLFEKELNKSLVSLPSSEVPVLQQWCYRNFSDRLMDILNKVFGITSKI